MDDGAGAFDRRIGHRVDADARPVHWHESPYEGGTEHRPRQEALLLDVSISGAGLVVAADWAPPPGSNIVIEIDGPSSMARVVRSEPTADPDITHLAVVFCGVAPPFQAALNELIGGPPPPASPYWE